MMQSMMTKTTLLGIALILCLIACVHNVQAQNTFTVPGNDDDAVTYTGFHATTRMPFARSDMNAVLVDAPFSDYATKGPRIFLVGGCVANQTCNIQVRVSFGGVCTDDAPPMPG